jgi:DNA-binding GntR family transcriptional regulator
MTLLPLTRTGPADDVAETLRQEVLSGFHPPGTPLDDADVVARLGVPREVARGALASLEREGLLVHSLRRGLEVVRLSVDDVRDLFATRRTLELAGLEAMVRGRPADDVWLQAAVQSMTQAAAAGDGRAAVAADAAFHLAIVASTSSRRIRLAAEAAFRELRIVLAFADRVSGDLDELAADHAGLMEVIVQAPPPSARAALLDHLRRNEQRVLAVV